MDVERLVLVGHGQTGYACRKFPLPTLPSNVRLGWYYNPYDAETSVVCANTRDMAGICARPPAFVSNPGDTYPDLTITRADDIGSYTGLYNCSTGQWIGIPQLGPSYPSQDPRLRTRSTCLSEILRPFVEQAPERYEIYVVVCGATSMSDVHPTRTIVHSTEGSQPRTLQAYYGRARRRRTKRRALKRKKTYRKK
jgi:hypothetical protein